MSPADSALRPEMSDPDATIVHMIRETVLDTVTADEDAPVPGRLRVAVTADTARLTWASADPPDLIQSFQVPARSLLLALRAAWDDSHPGTADIDVPQSPKPRREPRPGAPNSRQPWTADLDTVLKDTWLGTPSTTPATTVIGELAKGMGRSRGSIRARLARVGCDPDVPGRTLRPEEPPDEPADQ